MNPVIEDPIITKIAVVDSLHMVRF